MVFYGGELGHRLFLRWEVCNPDQSVELMFMVRGEGYIDAVAGLTRERQ